MRSLVCEELGASVQEADSSWLDSLYCDISQPLAIEEYLHGDHEYCRGRWTNIPAAPATISELHDPFCRLIDSIAQHLSPAGVSGTREITIIRMKEEESRADLVIRATGPSFSTLSPSSVEFSNVAACISVRLDSESGEVWSHLAHLKDWAKNIFIAQPNRFFVRCMVLTESQGQIFHFDRSGVQYTRLLDIHREPEIFVRLILGLLTTRERVLGLDDTVQWTTSPNGERVSGFVKTVGPNAVPVTYELVVAEKPLFRSNLLGRGTTCWTAKNDRGETLIIKDYWVLESSDGNQSSEFDLLEEVKGLHGICQMICYEDNRAQTRDFRGDTSTFTQASFHNRRNIRIVMKAYGPSIENFTSIEQLLGALRDAIAAHKLLVSRKIVHRDISPNNILLRGNGMDQGSRSIIIDLDHALRTNGFASEVRADFKKGTRMFQSVMSLKSYDMETEAEYIPLYDYLDDLEAFFWVLLYLILSFKPNGEPIPSKGFRERTLRGWSQLGPDVAHDFKCSFLISSSNILIMRKTMDPGWQVIFDDFFLGFRAFVREIVDEKESLVYTSPTVLPDGTLAPNRFEPILTRIDDHYHRVLTLFDEALAKVAGSIPTSTPSPSKSPSDSVQSASTPTSRSPSTPISSSNSVATSATAVEPVIPRLDDQTVSAPAPSSALKLSASPGSPSSSSSQRKRRCEEAELDDEPQQESKRRCPPCRRQFRGILDSAYQFCRTLLFQ
ncbi:hypothetical protein MD484_g4878, partial [Candolleomyces efflorescens]